ncbi:MAG TPA: fasciclin domain-containing protein, partial [Cryomorphaceae bacterium]|nr:fasciclin domain-containing protein [Cryomorphaceae bacterium]
GDLTTVLTHHVANGIAYSTDLSDGQSVPTLQGEDVTVGIDGAGVVTITSATGVEAEVIVANLIASNGVVHVIDAVLIPTLSSVDNLSSVDDLSVFPNPTNNQFTLDLELNASERVTVDLVNIVGQVVKSVDLGTRSIGLNREYIDVNDLSEGIYFMNLTVGDTQGTVKVQVVR